MNMFFGSPAEMLAAMRARQAHHAMHNQNYEHGETEFLLSLIGEKDGKPDPEKLQFFLQMLQRMQSLDWYVPYMLGRVDHLLVEVGVCTCGIDHEAELAELFKEQPFKCSVCEVQAPHGHTPDGAVVGPLDGLTDEELLPIHDMLAGQPPTKPVEMIDPESNPELLAEYGMEFVVPQHIKDSPIEVPRIPILRCANCKKPYVTMEDRMLKAPKEAGCDGCQIKSGHGTGWAN